MKVSFRCVDGIHLLCAEDGGGTEATYPRGIIVANRENEASWERFEAVQNPGTGRWGFKADNGSWVSAQQNGVLVANRERPVDWLPEAWEAFEVIRHSDGAVSLKSDHGKFVCAENGGGSLVVADRNAINAWETFRPSKDFISGIVPDKPAGRGRVAGRFWQTSNGDFRPRFCSMLSILRRNDAETVQLLDWVVATGFNGIRVFAGNLTWAGQTHDRAAQRLPYLLAQCRSRGLYVEVTAVTDSANAPRYTERAHIDNIVRICRDYDNSLLELANEYWHPTQSDWTHDIRNLFAAYQDYSGGVASALGAPMGDEPEDMAMPTANYLTLHLDRGRDKWNMVRRVRELENASNRYSKPVMNNEPIGADEVESSGRRLNDPSIFFCMGALNRLFEVGGVHHSQHGLDAVMPGPVQDNCARHFIRGWSALKTTDRVSFWNLGWPGSPVKNADTNQVVRVYSGTWGNKGVTVLVGLRGDPRVEFNGWRSDGILDQVSGCQILSISRS